MEKESRPLWHWLIFFVLLCLVVSYVGVSWFFSDILIKFDTFSLEQDRSRLGINSPADFGLPQAQALSISANNVTLSGWFFPNTQPCAVLFLHGIGSTRYSMLKYGPMFWQKGCSLMFYDARAHGSSSGRFATYGYYESKDALSMIQELKRLTGLADKQIGMFGESYGAATAIMAAKSLPNLAFVIADSPFESLATIVHEQALKQYGTLAQLFLPGAFFISELRARFKVAEVSPLKSVEGLKVPLLLQHASADSYTPAKHSQDIFADSDKSKTMLYISNWGADHAEAYTLNPQGYMQVVNEFLSAYAATF